MKPARPGRIRVVALALLALVPAVLPAAPLQSGVTRLLDRYAAGEWDAVARAVTEREAASPGWLMPQLLKDGQLWIARAEGSGSERTRRLAAAALALEAAGAGRAGFPSLERRSLLTWGVSTILNLRERDEPIPPAVTAGHPPVSADEAERQWFLAVVALLSGSGDTTFLGGQVAIPRPPRGLVPLSRAETPVPYVIPRGSLLEVARGRFPDEPRFKLAEVYVEERRTAVLSRASVIAIQTQTPEDGVIPPRLLERRPDSQAVSIARPGFEPGAIPIALSLLDGVGAGFEALTSEASLRDEALLRLGYHRIRVGEHEAAMTALGQALEGAQDDDVRYLSHFFRGWVLHRDNHRAAAEAEYQGALTVYPASRQVRALLASVMADRGDRQAAREVLGEALSRRLPERDPWLLFHQGDYRFLSARIAAMREALR